MARKYPKIKDYIAKTKSRRACLVYPSTLDKDGYAFYNEKGLPARAHRAAYLVSRGKIPAGKSVLHKCDVRPCCNPNHLYAGTQKQNCRDAVKRRRHSFGERNGVAKLTEKQVRKILKDRRTQKVIAKDYGILQTTVSSIKTKRNWKHV